MAPRPAWTLNVAAMGYARHTLHISNAEFPWLPTSIGPLCFQDDDTIVVSFVRRCSSETLGRRAASSVALPLGLEALFIGAADGRLRESREWPTSSWMSRTTPAPGGRIAAVFPDRVLLYTAALAPAGRIDLNAVDARRSGHVVFLVSPRPGFLVAYYGAPRGRREVILLDLGAERIVQSHSEDRSVVFGGETNVSDSGSQALPQSRDHQIYGFFVGDDSIFFWRPVLQDSVRVGLVSLGGLILFRETWYRRIPTEPRVPASNGRRFAIAVNKLTGGSVLLDIGAHASLWRVLVFDIAARRWIYALDCKKGRIKSISGLALSPDGTLLALIDQDGILEVFRLPPADPSPN